jgi:hypothetical protein
LLKTILYVMLFFTTTARLADMLYLLATDSTDLPLPVLAVTAAMLLYGMYLIVRRFLGNIRLKQLMGFFVAQTGVILFNIAFTAVTSPLQIGLADTLLVGTFLDILVNACVIYFCVRQMRGGYAPVSVGPVRGGGVNG